MPFIMKLANTSSRSVLLRSALDAECPTLNTASAQDSDSSKPSNERYRCRLQQASNMPVEVFPGASQPSRRDLSEVRSATDSSNSARNDRRRWPSACLYQHEQGSTIGHASQLRTARILARACARMYLSCIHIQEYTPSTAR